MMQGYKESLIAWFGRTIDLSECADGSVLITVPIVDEYNDDISLYIYDRGDSFRISDKGETFRSLYGMSLSLKDDCDARTAIDAVLARFGAYLSDSDKSIISECRADTLPDAVMFMAQAVASVENMKYGSNLHRVRGPSFFHGLESFFQSRAYRYVKKPRLIGLKGIEHTFDYRIASSDNEASALVSIISGGSRSTNSKFSLLYEWNDVRERSVDHDSLMIAVESSVRNSERSNTSMIGKINNEMYRNGIILVGTDEYEDVFQEMIG